MNKTQIYFEENSFINYCYLNIIFYDLFLKSKNILDKISLEENSELKKIFIQNNKQNKDKYYKQKLLIINQTEEAKKEKVDLIKSKIGLDFDNFEDKEDEIMKEINNKIIYNIKQMASGNNKLNEMISDFYPDYLIESFSIFYNIIKLMKKNGDKKIGNLSQKYLYEEEKKQKSIDLNIKNLKKQISSLKSDIKKNNIENSKKIGETNKKYEDLMKKFTENEKKLNELISENKKVISKNEELITKNKKVISENEELISENKKVISENKELFSENKKIISENKELFSENKEIREKLKENESEIKTIKKEWAKEKEETQIKLKEILSLKNEVAWLKKEHKVYEKKISDLQKKIDKLNADLNEANIALIQKDLELRIVYNYVEAYGNL